MEFNLDTMDVFQTDEHQRAGAFRAYVDAGLKPSFVAEMLGMELPDGWEYADLDPDEPEPGLIVAPSEDANSKMRDILGYHIETGTVTRNEARANLGLPPIDETEDARMRDLRTKLDILVIAKSAGLGLAEASRLVGLDITEPEPQPQPPELAPAPEPMIDDADEPEGFGMPGAKAMLDDLRAWRRKSKKAGRLAEFHSDAIPVDTMAAIRSAGDWLAALDAAIEQPAAAPVKAQPVEVVALVDALRAMTEALLNDA
jgi:hypothetical protein